MLATLTATAQSALAHPLALALLQVANPDNNPRVEPNWGAFIVATVVKIILTFTFVMVGVALLTLAERKVSAWIQDRHGPNRVGWHGLAQPVADGLKNIMKEETYPGEAYKPLFILAPALAFIPALMTFAVIPFASPWGSPWGRIDMVVADLPIGFLYILALTSLGVYGLVIAGWSSNNKYAMLGGIRSSAQMVSYEIAMGMSLVAVLLVSGNVSLGQIIWNQATGVWYFGPLLIAFFIFTVAAFAETNRLPFDLPEAESELITGYHTEYSAMKFSFFFIAEYANMVTASALMVTLFFGGWDIPFTLRDNLSYGLGWTLLTAFVFWLKAMSFVFLFIWVRWTLPRFRYDQLMSLGWKFMLPLALGYIILMAGLVLWLDWLNIAPGPLYGTILILVNVMLAAIVFLMLDQGRLISPASRPARTEEIARLRAMKERGEVFGPAQAGD